MILVGCKSFRSDLDSYFFLKGRIRSMFRPNPHLCPTWFLQASSRSHNPLIDRVGSTRFFTMIRIYTFDSVNDVSQCQSVSASVSQVPARVGRRLVSASVGQCRSASASVSQCQPTSFSVSQCRSM